MTAITPPPVKVAMETAPDHIESGDQMAFTLQLGPLAIRWVAQLENVSEGGFVDRQLQGPFASWTHRHEFITLDSRRTEVVDRVEATLQRDPFARLLGALMWLNLPLLFAYRGWKTRRLLRQDGGDDVLAPSAGS